MVTTLTFVALTLGFGAPAKAKAPTKTPAKAAAPPAAAPTPVPPPTPAPPAPMGAAPAAPPPVAGRVVSSRGHATSHRGTEEAALSRGSVLYQGDEVQTAEDSALRILLQDDSV